MADAREKIGGRYILGDQLGRGGMATVYRAHDPQFGRDVAVKMLHNVPGDELEEFLVKKFRQEAKIIASLEHYAIVPVYDYGSHDGWPYLVMRLMDGGTLKDSITQGALPLAEIEIVLERICAALDRAHAKNIVHRDIKPTNIFMDNDGLVYLGDFGIARLTQGDQTTSYLGSPRYMAPEQAQGEPLSPATDIYQMGIVLFEMLTGQKPYSGETPEQTILMHLQHDIPRPTELNPDLPMGMNAVIDLAMAKDPAERLQSARDLADAFKHALSSPPASMEYDYDFGGGEEYLDEDAAGEPVLGSRPIMEVEKNERTGYAVNKKPFFLDEDHSAGYEPSPQTFWQKNGVLVGIGVLALAIVLCGLAYLGGRAAGLIGEQADPQNNVILPAPDLETVVEEEPVVDEPEVVENDADPVATVTLAVLEELEIDVLEIAELGGGSGNLTYSAELDGPFSIYAVDESGVRAISNNTFEAYGAVYSPDGRMIAWHAQHPIEKTWEIYVANADGTGQRNLTGNSADDSFPRWSPDGSQIVFHSNRNDQQFDIFVINTTGGVATQLTSTDMNELGPSFSPDGSRIVFHRRISRNVSELFVMNPDGTGEQQMTTLGRSSEFASWSPDGERVVFHAFSDDHWQLFVADPLTGGASQITFEDQNSFYAKWSPNGQWLAFHSEVGGGNRDLFLVRPDGNELTRLTSSATQERMPDWQP